MDYNLVTLLIEDHIFKVRKSLLCEYSDYFRAMFSGNYVEKEQKEISINVIDPVSMNIILGYMELGLIDLSEFPFSTVGDLAIAANFLQITELIKQIDYYLEEQLSLKNWLEIKDIAQNASSAKLEQAASTYGLLSFKSMRPEFIPTIQKLFWYLSHPYLNTDSEYYVFKFGINWVEHFEKGGDCLLIILCCLDISKLNTAELKDIKFLIRHYVNSLTEKVVDCFYKLSTDYELSLAGITKNKVPLCELFSEKVYNEVLNFMKESVQRKLKFTPVVPMWSHNDAKPELSPNYLFTFTEEEGFQQWLEVAEKNLWGWNITSWGPTKIVVVCGEHGRGTGSFMREVKIYDVQKKEWIRHGVQLPLRRHGAVTVLGDLLFIVGGVGGFRVVLDTAIVYNLKRRSFRQIALLPDAIQTPAICTHENAVYAAGYKNVYKYEDLGDKDKWTTVLETDIRANCLVSFKGYIYMSQSYFCNLYRFQPNSNAVLEEICQFSNPPVAICNLGYRLLAFTCSSSGLLDDTTVEEYQDTDTHITKVLATGSSDIVVNGVAGSCAVVLMTPPVTPEVSAYHKRYITMYG